MAAESVAEDASNAKRSVSAEGMLEPYQRQEFAKLFANKKIQGRFEEWQSRDKLSAAFDDARYGGYHSQVNMSVQKRLTEEANKVGVNSDFVNVGHNAFGMPVQHIANENELAQLAPKTEAAGGSSMKDAAARMMQAAEMIVDAQKRSETQDRQNAQQVKPALPAAPAVMGR
jgi:hypothetical protein